jgi:hypothetical protein
VETRKDFARAGMRCWALDSPNDPLPPGLADRTEVTVIRTGTQPQGVLVRDRNDTQWSLYQWQLDCGWLCQIEGDEWFPESDPQVLALFAQLLTDARANGTDPPFGSEHHISIGDLEWLLRRNGHPVVE